MPKIVYTFDPETHVYLKPLTLDDSDLSPLEEGVYLMPANALDAEPPIASDGMRVIEVGGAWVLETSPIVQMPEPTVEQRIARLNAVITRQLDSVAQTKGYDNIINAALRAGYPGPYHEEGVAFATWMDATYAKAYELLGAWQAGELEEPTPETLVAMLPRLQLPLAAAGAHRG